MYRNWFVAIDPGDVHVGFAIFEPWQGSWRVRTVAEITPDQLVSRLSDPDLAAGVDEVVIEEFKVYPHTATALIGSDLPTARLIGMVELLCERAGVPLIKQPAHILPGTEALLKHQRQALVSVFQRRGGHAKDAELHGWYRILKGRA